MVVRLSSVLPARNIEVALQINPEQKYHCHKIKQFLGAGLEVSDFN